MLLVEDVHWADDAALDVLRYLAWRIPELPAVPGSHRWQPFFVTEVLAIRGPGHYELALAWSARLPAVQRAVSGLLAPIARLTGQRALDPVYLAAGS